MFVSLLCLLFFFLIGGHVKIVSVGPLVLDTTTHALEVALQKHYK